MTRLKFAVKSSIFPALVLPLLIVFAGVLPRNVLAAEIHLETFESGGGYTVSDTDEFTDGGQDYWCRLKINSSNPDCYDVNGSNIGDIDGISATDFNNIQGDFAFGGEDLDGEGASLPIGFEITNIDISGKSNLKLSALSATNSPVDWDSPEFMKIQYEVDSSGSWTDALCYADDGSKAALDTDCDGVGDGRTLSDTFTADTVSIDSTGDSINFRVEYSFDAGSERGFLDDIRLTGDQSGDDGTFKLSPGNDVAVDGRQTWTLTYEAGNSSWDSGTLQFDVPDEWGNPQITQGSQPNFTTVSITNGTIADSRVLSGDTIELDVESMTTNGQVDVKYGDSSRSQKGYTQVPSVTGPYTVTALADTDGSNPARLQFPDETLNVVNPDNSGIVPGSNPESFIGVDYDIEISITGGGNNLYGAVVEAQIRGGNGSDSHLSRVESEDYLSGGGKVIDTGLTRSDGAVEFNFTTATQIETDVVDFKEQSAGLSLEHRDALRNPFPVISEVGWDSTEEYFELYNPTLNTVDLSGWWVSNAAGNTEIDTSVFNNLGSIGPHRYLVIERSEDAVEGQSDEVYSSMSLADAGETLFLRNSSNVQVDEHSAGGGWHAGIDGQHVSMEREFAVQTGELERSWSNADSTAIYADAPTDGEGSPGFSNSASLGESSLRIDPYYTNADTVDVALQIRVDPGDTQPDMPTKIVSDNASHSVKTQSGITDEDGYSTGVLSSSTNEGTSTVKLKLPVSTDSGAISDTVVFDYTAPDSVNITRKTPEDGTETSTRNIDFSWSSVPDTLSGLSHYRLEISRNSTFTDRIVNDTYTSTSVDPSGTSNLADTVYWWRVRAIDQAGNRTSFSSSDTFLVDGTSPQPFGLLTPDAGVETNVLTVPFNWNSSSDSLAGVNNYTLKTDTGTGFTDPLVFEGSTVSTDTKVTYSGENQVVWQVRVSDEAGNTTVSGDSQFLIDRSPPAVDSGSLSVTDGSDTALLGDLDGDSALANGIGHDYKLSVAGATTVRIHLSTDGSLATTSDSYFRLSNTMGDTWTGSLQSDSFTAGDSVNFVVEASDTATNSVVSDSAGDRYRYRIVDNSPPSVDFTRPDTDAYVGGSDVSGTYVLTDPEDDPGTVTVEVSDDSGVTWDTEATVSGEIESVSSSSTGDTHNISWDTLLDFGSVEDTTVKLRIRAFDGADTGKWDTSPFFTVDNVAPKSITISSTADVTLPDTGVSVYWTETPSDLEHYNLYRSYQTADTSGATRVDTGLPRSDTTVIRDDSAVRGDSYYVYVTVVDTAGNESDSSNATTAPNVTFKKTDNADSIHRPGDTIIYTINYVNDGFGPTGEIVLIDAIPDSTVLADTASVDSGPAATIEYSTDGGASWQSSSYPRNNVTHTRWTVTTRVGPELPNGKTGRVSFKVTIE
ncbi:MAG: lamin tail domain-containing protein [bacterium]